MNLPDLLRRYRSFDPATGQFDRIRSQVEYATLLGVDNSLLSHIFAGRKQPGLEIVRGLARLTSGHPQFWHELMAVLAKAA